MENCKLLSYKLSVYVDGKLIWTKDFLASNVLLAQRYADIMAEIFCRNLPEYQVLWVVKKT